jgi:hypothetical protein
LDSLRDSTERIAASIVTLAGRVISDKRVSEPAGRVQREFRQARAVGQFAVLSAAAKVKRVLEPDAPEVTDEAPTGSSGTTSVPVAVVTPAAPHCLPDYTNLSASQIIPLLRALTPNERADVLAYEEATRQRKTILAALRRPPA